ncbi:hypothetical protein CLU79DRAFT_838467 [Phycomyces nitens]|nr:hypothetical protein CLU79DRAFT_838467 [Phycomyces nitens]
MPLNTAEASSSSTRKCGSLAWKPWYDASLILPNKPTVARDQLANERNWLTVFRFSCTMIILGFTVLLKFRFPDDQINEPEKESKRMRLGIGYTFIAIGFILYIGGLGKYFKNQLQLARQVNFIQAGWGSFIGVGLIFCFACIVMILATIRADLFNSI